MEFPMIDLSDHNTWPPGILELLACNSIDTRREKAAELEAHLAHRLNPPPCIIFRRTQDCLESMLRGLEVRAFHCTRLLNPQAIKQNGLEVLSPNVAKARTLDALRQFGVQDNLLRTATLAFDECHNRGDCQYREGLLCFVLTKRSMDDNGCADFFRYFGGEIARHALHDLARELFPVLESIGVPTVVEARLPIVDAQDYQISRMAEELIRFGECKFLDEKHYAMNCEIRIRYTVPPERILAVYEKQFSKQRRN
jgi:hypothetical protein